jgi:hypothetical protein
MAFKLYSDASLDQPVILCDVCSQPMHDLWGGKATGTPTNDGQLSVLTLHHAACSASGAVTISLIEFFRLFVITNRVGDVGSDGVLEKACVEYPMGKGFEV